jgi:hypothetical protein
MGCKITDDDLAGAMKIIKYRITGRLNDVISQSAMDMF